MADDSTSATPAPDKAPAQPATLLTIPQLAAGVKRRIPELQSVPDALVARRMLEAHPELIHNIQTYESRKKLKQEQAPSGSQPETQIKSILSNKRYEDLSFEEKSHVLSLGFKAYAQREQGKAHGDNTQWLARATHWVKSLLGETGGVAIEATGSATNPKNAAIAATGLADPAIPATYFAVKGALDLPGQIQEAQKHPSPENVQAPLLTGSMVAAGAAGAADTAREAAAGAAEKARTGIRIASQEVAGAGREHIQGEIRERGARVQEREASHAEKVKSTEQANAEAAEAHSKEVERVASENAEATAAYRQKVADSIAEHDAKVEATKKQYADNVAAREQKIAEINGQHEEKIAKARGEWVQKAFEAKQAGREAAKVEGRREALKHGQDAYTRLVDENVKTTHNATRGALDERWNQLREKVGVDTPVKAPPLYNAVESGRAMLAGVPGDLKIFNDIVKEVTEKPGGDEVGRENKTAAIDMPKEDIITGETVNPTGLKERVPKESITFDDARTQFSAVGEKAYAAEGNLRRALFTLYDAYDKELNATANAAGQGKEYGALKGDWKQYMQDWHDMRGEATGGSPLARLYRAVDDPVVAKKVLSQYGDRLRGMIARYEKFGGSASLMSKLRDFNAVSKSLPKVKVPAMPGKLETPASPKLPAEVTPPEPVTPPKSVPQPKLKETPEPPAPKVTAPMKPVPPVDAFRSRLAALERFSASSAAWLPWRIADKLLLKSDRIREWVASQPRSGDPDFIADGMRNPATREQTKAAAAEVYRLNVGSTAAFKDYLRGSITRDGFKQRVQALFPSASAADVEEVAASVDKSRAAARP